jgi:methionyl-tRNA synthetase
MLNIDAFSWENLGKIDLLKTGHILGTPEILFQKIEDEQINVQIERLERIKKENELKNFKPKEIKNIVGFEDFSKIDIRVGTVLECQKVPKADKLLQFKIADGNGERTILSGIAQSYPNPAELVGKQVCFISNFASRKLRGIDSEGMILSAENADGKLVLIEPSRVVQNGVNVG